jgi:hypothetical protein
MNTVNRGSLVPGATLEELPGRGVVVLSDQDVIDVLTGTGLEQVASALNRAGVVFSNQGLYLRIETQAPAEAV